MTGLVNELGKHPRPSALARIGNQHPDGATWDELHGGTPASGFESRVKRKNGNSLMRACMCTAAGMLQPADRRMTSMTDITRPSASAVTASYERFTTVLEGWMLPFPWHRWAAANCCSPTNSLPFLVRPHTRAM
jgi:hypothetical protein